MLQSSSEKQCIQSLYKSARIFVNFFWRRKILHIGRTTKFSREQFQEVWTEIRGRKKKHILVSNSRDIKWTDEVDVFVRLDPTQGKSLGGWRSFYCDTLPSSRLIFFCLFPTDARLFSLHPPLSTFICYSSWRFLNNFRNHTKKQKNVPSSLWNLFIE